jgi:hypothetical protein
MTNLLLVEEGFFHFDTRERNERGENSRRVTGAGSGWLWGGKNNSLPGEKMAERLGKQVEIVKILVRDLSKERQVVIEKSLLTTRFSEVLEAGADVIVEVIGGVQSAGEYIEQAFKTAGPRTKNGGSGPFIGKTDAASA